MKWLPLFLLLMHIGPLTAQDPVESLWFYSQGRDDILQSDAPLQHVQLYHDELFLLENKARCRTMKSLTIKARYYGATLKTLPWSITSLDSLTQFRVEDIDSLDWVSAYSTLAALPGLRMLSIDGCPGSLVPELAALQSLERLFITSVYSGSLDGIWTLSNLHQLSMRACGLNALPDGVNNLTRLKRLELAFNDIASFPSSLNALTRLAHLDLMWNSLSEFPQAVLQLPLLQTLDLTHNKIRRLPDSVWMMRSLKNFHVPWNRLHELPEGIGKMDSLTVLDISMNRIRTVPTFLLKCDNLLKLYCWSSRLHKNSPVLELFIASSRLRNRAQLWADTLAHYAKIIPGWKEIFADDTVAFRYMFWQDVLIGDLSNYDATPEIAPLYFKRNRTIDIDEFARWRERKNPIYTAATKADIWFDYPIFPFGYRRMTNLTEVEIVVSEPWMLSKRLLRPLTKCKDLAILRIDDPYIRKVPPAIRKMKNLEVLELECGGIKELPEWLTELPKLREITIYKDVVVPGKLEQNVKIKYF